MRFAYLILAHHNVDQLARLVERLLEGNDDEVYLHLDARCPPGRRLLGTAAAFGGRMRFIRKPLKVYWGHWSQCRATAMLLAEARKGRGDYFHLLSGADWPLVTRRRMAEQIAADGGDRCYLRLEPGNFAHRMQEYRFEDRHLNPRARALPFLWRYKAALSRLSASVNAWLERSGRSRPQPLGPWVKGSQWWSLPRDAAEHVDDQLRRLLKSGRLRHTACSDEHAIQTIIANSPFAARMADYRRMIFWPPRSDSPETLTRDRLEQLRSGNDWFARKFDAAVDDFFYDL
jgi:hypothetical protein